MTNSEFKIYLEKRTRVFAVETFRLFDSLPDCPSSRVITFQLGKAASSIGANYREANRAESKSDFIHKLGIVLKETAESDYWFAILLDPHPGNEEILRLANENLELIKLFNSSCSTAKKNSQTK